MKNKIVKFVQKKILNMKKYWNKFGKEKNNETN